MTLEQIIAAGGGQVDRAKVAATTKEDIRRHMIEDDAPMLTAELLERAEVFQGNVFVRSAHDTQDDIEAGEQVSVRLDPDVLAKLREAGPGWQTRINGILRKAVLGDADG